MSENFLRVKEFILHNWKPLLVGGYIISLGVLLSRK